jgi:hypothetical protein
MLAPLHGALVCAWLGVVSVEIILELARLDSTTRRFVAVVHARIDNFIEIPLVIAILVSGGVLLYQAWPASNLLLIKVACGLTAIVANVICIPLVQQRVRVHDDSDSIRLTQQIRLTGLAGPFAIAALVIGFGSFG